jgi:hypothetical protein
VCENPYIQAAGRVRRVGQAPLYNHTSEPAQDGSSELRSCIADSTRCWIQKNVMVASTWGRADADRHHAHNSRERGCAIHHRVRDECIWQAVPPLLDRDDPDRPRVRRFVRFARSRIAANLPTPWVGLTERISIFGYMLCLIRARHYALTRPQRCGFRWLWGRRVAVGWGLGSGSRKCRTDLTALTLSCRSSFCTPSFGRSWRDASWRFR